MPRLLLSRKTDLAHAGQLIFDRTEGILDFSECHRPSRLLKILIDSLPNSPGRLPTHHNHEHHGFHTLAWQRMNFMGLYDYVINPENLPGYLHYLIVHM